MYTDSSFGPQIVHVCHVVPLHCPDETWNVEAPPCSWVASQATWPAACAEGNTGLVLACAEMVGEMVMGGGVYAAGVDEVWVEGFGKDRATGGRRCRRGRRRGGKGHHPVAEEVNTFPSESGTCTPPFLLDSLDSFPPLKPGCIAAPHSQSEGVHQRSGERSGTQALSMGMDSEQSVGHEEMGGTTQYWQGASFDTPDSQWQPREDLRSLAMSKDTCRDVQKRLEEASGPARDELVEALIPFTVELYESPHGNHVLTKAIEVSPSSALGPIVEQIQAKGCLTVAKHRFGCRVLERLIEHCTQQEISSLIDQFVDSAEELSRHDYGNFVIQHLLEHGDDHCRTSILQRLLPQAPMLAMHRKASHVVQCALKYCSLAGQREIVDALFRAEAPQSLVDIADSRYGSYVAEELFSALRFPDTQDLLQEALRRFKAALPERRASTYFPRVAETFKLLELEGERRRASSED